MEQLYPIDDFFKQRISLHEFPPLPEAWADMEAKLSAIQPIPTDSPADFTPLDNFFKDKIATEPLAFVPNAWAQMEQMLGGLEAEPANGLDDFFRDKIATEPLAFVPNAWAQMEQMLGGLEAEPANGLDDFFRDKIATEPLAFVPSAWAQMDAALEGLAPTINGEELLRERLNTENLDFVPNAWAQMEALMDNTTPEPAHFDDDFRYRLQVFEPDFIPAAWADMDAKLEAVSPQKSRYAGWWFWSSVCLATVASVLGLGLGNYTSKQNPTQLVPSVNTANNVTNSSQEAPLSNPNGTNSTENPALSQITGENKPQNQTSTAQHHNNSNSNNTPKANQNPVYTPVLSPSANMPKVAKNTQSEVGNNSPLNIRKVGNINNQPANPTRNSSPKNTLPAPNKILQDTTPSISTPIAQNVLDTAAVVVLNPIENQDPANPNTAVASLSQNFLEVSPVSPSFLPVVVENLTEKPVANTAVAALDLKAPKTQKWSVGAWLGVSNRISKTLNQPAFSASPMFGAGLTYKIQDRQSVQFGLQYKPVYMNVEDAFFGFVPGEEPKAERDSVLGSGADMLTQFVNAKMRVFHLHRLDMLELPIAYKYQISKRHSFSFVLKTSCVFSANVREFGADTSTKMSRSAIGINYVDVSTGLGYEFRLNKHLSLLAQFHMGLMNLTYKAQTKYRNYVTYSSVPASEGNIYLKLPEETQENLPANAAPPQARILELPEKLKNSDFQIALRYTF